MSFSLSDTHKAIVAAVGIAALSVGGYKYFLPRSEAAEQVKAAEQKAAKSVTELRVEVLLNRVKQINDKPKPTSDEKLELQLLMEQIKAIQAEKVKK